MKGKISIDSTPGEGTQCCIKLPLSVDASDNKKEQHITGKINKQRKNDPNFPSILPHSLGRSNTVENLIEPISGRLKILTVDDCPIILLTLKSMLSSLNCEVFTANNGKMAIEILRSCNHKDQESPIQLVILDVNMLIKNGYETTGEITKLINSNIIKPVKLACLSAQDSKEHKKLCYKSGIQYIMQKPCSKAQLSHLLSLIVQNPKQIIL